MCQSLALTFWGREGRGGNESRIKDSTDKQEGGDEEAGKKEEGNCGGICALSFLQAVAQPNVQPPGWEESADLRCHGGSREGKGGGWGVCGGGYCARLHGCAKKLPVSHFMS